jgi:hypothetical protein
MKSGHVELLRKTFMANPGAFKKTDLEEPLKSPSLASLASTLSIEGGKSVNSVVTTISNKSQTSLSVSYNLNKIDQLIIQAAEKGLRKVDEIEALQKNDSESSLIHGVKVQEAYENVIENGKLTHDTTKLTEYLDILQSEYNAITNKEIESLGKYEDNEVISDIMSQYKSDSLYTDNKKIQDDLFALVNSKLDELQELIDDGVDVDATSDVFIKLAREDLSKRKSAIDKIVGEDEENVEENYNKLLQQFEEEVVQPMQQHSGYDYDDDEAYLDPVEEQESQEIEDEYMIAARKLCNDIAEEHNAPLEALIVEEEDDLVNLPILETYVVEVDQVEDKTQTNNVNNVREHLDDWSVLDLDSPFLDYNEKQILMDGNCIDFAEASKQLRNKFPKVLNRTQKYTHLYCLKRFRAIFQVPETTNIRDDPKKEYYNMRTFKQLWNEIVGDKSVIIYEYLSNLELLTKEYCLKELAKYHPVPLEPKKYRKVISKTYTKAKYELSINEVIKANKYRAEQREYYTAKKEEIQKKLDNYKNRQHKIKLFADIKINRLQDEINTIQNRINNNVDLPLPNLQDCIVYKYKTRNEWLNWNYVRHNGAEAAYAKGIINPHFRPKYEDIDINKITTHAVDQTKYETKFAVLCGNKIELRKKVRKKSENYVKVSRLTLKIGIYNQEDMEDFLRKEILKINDRKLTKKAKVLILSTEKGSIYRSLKSLIAFGFISKQTCALTKRYRYKLAKALNAILNLDLTNHHALPAWKKV